MAKKVRLAPEGANPPKPEPMVECPLLWVGTNETTAGQLAFLWLPLDQFKPDMSVRELHDKASLFEGKKGKHPRVLGGVYAGKVIRNEEGRVVRMEIGPNWKDHPPKSPVWAQVKLAMEALEVVRRMKKMEAKAGQIDHIENMVLPIRTIWLLTDTRGRAAVEAIVLNAIRGR